MEANQPHAGRATSSMAAHTGDVAAMERLLEALQSGETVPQESTGSQYLVVTCAGVKIALSLAFLREVLSSTPAMVPLPFTPPWFLGIFPLRNEMLGLADPAPLLLPDEASTSRTILTSDPQGHPRPAVVVGEGERSLAWLVDAVGDIAQFTDDEIIAYERDSDDKVPASRYALGMARCPGSDGECVILDTQAALGDMLGALVESDRSDE